MFFLFFVFTEDNNTRVLFERVLTSGSLSPEKSGLASYFCVVFCAVYNMKGVNAYMMHLKFTAYLNEGKLPSEQHTCKKKKHLHSGIYTLIEKVNKNTKH